MTVALNSSSGPPDVPDGSIQVSVGADLCADLDWRAFQTLVISSVWPRSADRTWTVGSMSLVVAIDEEFNRARSILGVTTR